MCVVWITVTRNKLYWCHGYLLVQHADCRLDTKCRLGTKCCLQTAEWVQNADWESKEFFIWYGDIMSSCNLPSIISFHDYLQYCGIFLALFLMKIDRNIISNLYRVFSICTRVGCCDVSTDFTNIIKVDVDVNEMSLLNI